MRERNVSENYSCSPRNRTVHFGQRYSQLEDKWKGQHSSKNLCSNLYEKLVNAAYIIYEKLKLYKIGGF